MATLDDDLDRQLRVSEERAAQAARLRGVPGVGRVLSLTLLADLPSWAPWIGGDSPAWSGWPPSTVIRANAEDHASSGEDARGCVPSSTWRPSSPPASTR